MRILLVDLDDTLLDVAGFKQELFSSLAKNCGLDQEVVEQIYNKTNNKSDIEGFLDRFITELSAASSASEGEIYKVIEDKIRNIQIIEPVLYFIRSFKGKKVIFTFGDDKFQNLKINTLKLSQYFDKIIITADDKVDYLSRLISTKKTPLSQSGVPLTSAFKLPLSEEQLEEVFSFKLENLKRKPRTFSPRKFITNNKLNLSGKVYDEVLMVDDRQKFLDQVKSKFPWITIINVDEIKKHPQY